ncbi:phage antirepressor N-terminal domain-containing protein [Pseudomonas arsenicoxydans]|uniref:Antirepressor protein ant N-terminal domain-containing protein n=1 Tax=Pseudomonas arsenicoxydans TaxID=702115 RepID=A0A4P6GC11_9PSED|nr:phage antirepressor N-terminal domain-containing protein [Pseudomonas arsenicoxydans]QAY87212.1 hypothetical protein CUN61_26145 [Pseudomonas arsenicoxydans]
MQGNRNRKSSRHKKTPALAGAEVGVNEINFEEEIVMSDISTAVAKSNVIPFRSSKLLLVERDGQPFVPMKPVVEGMGLAWQTQHRKLMAGRFASVITMMVTTGFDGKQYEMACLPLKKLPGWLMSIHASKVRPDLRENVLAYQDECDDALWAYWNEGHAVNHRGPDQAMTVLGQTIGTDGFHMLGAVVKGKVSSLPVPIQRRATAKIWSQTHAAFGVRSAADIPADQLDAARNFIAAYAVLEGEFIPKGNGKSFDIPEKLGECERYLVSADHHGNRQVSPVPMGAFVLTRQQFMQSMLVDRDMYVSTAEMFQFVALATENLRIRSLSQARRAAA